MGLSCFSLHVRGVPMKTFRNRVRKLLEEAGVEAFVAEGANGWLAMYPSSDFIESIAIDEALAAIKGDHAVFIGLHDSDVFDFWYARDGEIVDAYCSCPDYFGEADEASLEAEGEPETFSELLNAEQIEQLRALLKPRMIDGEDVGGETPAFEDERVVEFARLLGITGALGSFDSIESEETGEHFPAADKVQRIE